MIKKILFILITANILVNAQSNARGLFMSVGIGPRIPVANFPKKKIGMGLEVELSYTDISFCLSFFTPKGLSAFSGKQSFLKSVI
jgi:hypothetical protein